MNVHIHRGRATARLTAFALSSLLVGAGVMTGAGVAHATTVTLSGTMEGNLPINPGDTLQAGYDFTFPGGLPAGDTVNVTGGTVVVHAQCKDGSSVPLTITLPDQSYNVAASDSSWIPSGDQQSPLVWQGTLHVPSTLCGGQQAHAPSGATFSADFTSKTQAPLHLRMHYADNTSGSWSATVEVTPTPPPPQKGSLLVHKNAPSDSQSTKFTFDINCGSAGSFTRTVTGTGDSSPVNGLALGTKCTVHEEPLTGFVAQPDQTVTINSSTQTVVVTFTNTHTPPPPPKKGYIEICKEQSGTGLEGVVFTFTVQGKSVQVPVGACSAAIQVNAGNVTVTEVGRSGSQLVGVSTIPTNRLVSSDLANRTAVVKVVPGNISTQTIVTFTNKMRPGNGYLKICKVAGPGVAVGTKFNFSVGGSTVAVPAGPGNGYCEIAGKFAFGNETITETASTSTHVTAISVAPSNRKVSTNTSNRTAIVSIGSGVTEVTFTNAANG